MMAEPSVSLERPWLTLDFGRPIAVLSWAVNRPGFVTARRIVWREVSNTELPQGLDVPGWLEGVLASRGESNSVAFLTSRNVSRFRVGRANIGTATAFVVATVDLSNAERVGSRQSVTNDSYGTINIAAYLDTGLSQAAMVEALSIVVQARTAAILDVDIRCGSQSVTGTGTDCVAIAAPNGPTTYVGLHTDIGEALGQAVYQAVRDGAEDWKTEQEDIL